MRIAIRAALVILFVLAGFAAGFSIGKVTGFNTGSEWAIVQAGIIAKEMGGAMPVALDGEGAFRVVVKQQPDIYRKAWKQSEGRIELLTALDAERRAADEQARPVGVALLTP
ncbi:MAG: hypothetical protein M0042_08200 [Nitrospiraceae bacterium]|nr:hypothetical protein [Nitrospiraceae bacterium]